MENEIIELDVIPEKELSPYKEQSNWGMYAVKPIDSEVEVDRNDWGCITVSGIMPRLNLKEEYKIQIVEKDIYRGKMTYTVKHVRQELPTTQEGQKSFLKTLLTENQVEAVYKIYPNHDIIQLIKEDSLEYKKIHGFGEKTYKKICKRILDNIEYEAALSHLGQYDLGYNLIVKLQKHFGSTALLLQNIKDNPYSMTAVSGIGFKKADQIAKSIGFDMQSPFRTEAAIKYVIEEEENNGHTYIKQESLLSKVEDLTGIDEDTIFDILWEIEGVVIIDMKVALEKTYKRESHIAETLLSFLKNSTPLEFDEEEFIKEQEQIHGMILTEQQRSFFTNIKNHNVNFLIGYAGCGKSQLQVLLINLLDRLGLAYRLMAPTGKAAKVLSRYTDREVSTIHRAIGLGKSKDEEANHELTEDFIIIDETSMLDVMVASATLSKIDNPNVRILFIGDPFQIPSVSAGNFLYDMVESQVFPVTKLDIVFRQSEGGILDLATKIRKQEKFIDNSFIGVAEFGNNAIIASAPQEKMVRGYQYYVQDLLKKYGIDDIMILSPTKLRDLGTVEINNNVQVIVNPPNKNKKETPYGEDRVFRDGDNVINIKNTYDVETVDGRFEVDVVNGDTGRIVDIDLSFKEMIIDYGFAEVPLPFDELSSILHSYCITMHKAQGSAAKAVIVIMDKSHKFQLNANLVYTAWTRPEDFLVVLCQAEVINYAMRKVVNLQRNTWMRGILRELTRKEM